MSTGQHFPTADRTGPPARLRRDRSSPTPVPVTPARVWQVPTIDADVAEVLDVYGTIWTRGRHPTGAATPLWHNTERHPRAVTEFKLITSYGPITEAKVTQP